MKDVLLTAMPHDIGPAERLAATMKTTLAPIQVDVFPDQEVRVRATQSAPKTILYCSLDHPNAKLIKLILAASALRDLRAEKIILVAPYLCYMRQDKAFHKGEAISQQVIAKVLSPWIDHIITIEPHLHRVKNLNAVFPNIKATSLSASTLLASLIDKDGAKENALLVGPDQEARAWTKAVAEKAQIPYIVLTKERLGDRDVRVSLPAGTDLQGKRIYLIDDIVSSGSTLAASARLLKHHSAARIEALSVHALCSDEDLEMIMTAGVSRLRSTDTITHKTNAVSIAPLLSEALFRELSL